MTSVALVSAKGSPGVTTLACAMVLARADSGAVLIEADQHGGDLALHHGVAHAPGLTELAARAKRTTPGGDLLSPYLRPLAGGLLPAVIAPVDGGAVRAALSVLCDRADLLADADDTRTPVFDLGRAEPDSPGWMWLAACDHVLLVCRTDLTGLAHAAHLAEQLRDTMPAVALALIDSGPYPPAEAEASLGLPLAGLVPFSPKQASAVTDHAAVHSAATSRLTAAAGQVLDSVLQHAEVPVP